MSRACCHHYPGGISGCVSRSLHRRRRPSPFVWRVGSHIDAFEMLWGGDSETVVAVTRRSKMPQPNDLATTRSATPSAGTRRPVNLRSRAQRWRDAVAELAALQNECDAWLQSLPDSLQQSATAEALQAICDLDIGDLQAIEPPRGFGRD
jgi:hypothetical protein